MTCLIVCDTIWWSPSIFINIMMQKSKVHALCRFLTFQVPNRMSSLVSHGRSKLSVSHQILIGLFNLTSIFCLIAFLAKITEEFLLCFLAVSWKMSFAVAVVTYNFTLLYEALHFKGYVIFTALWWVQTVFCFNKSWYKSAQSLFIFWVESQAGLKKL